MVTGFVLEVFEIRTKLWQKQISPTIRNAGEGILSGRKLINEYPEEYSSFRVKAISEDVVWTEGGQEGK